MIKYLAWLYTNNGARLREVPVNDWFGSRMFEYNWKIPKILKFRKIIPILPNFSIDSQIYSRFRKASFGLY